MKIRLSEATFEEVPTSILIKGFFMLFKTKSMFLGLAATALTCAASIASAAPTVCTVLPSGSTYDATIAVASNFYGPAQDLVTSFIANDPAGSGKKIRVCQNSTATLDTEIRTGTSGYSLLLAANASTPNALVGTAYVQSGATSRLYAKGIPVIFAPTTAVANVGTFISGLGSGTAATISSAVSPAIAINTTNSQKVAVANPTLAPYGLAASSILNDMGLWNASSPVPSWMHNPLYDNIDLTYAAVIGGTDKSGFVSKAQICGNLGTVTYIAFTGYLLNQNGILINSGNSTQNALGSSIMSYMLSNSSPTFWSTFLTNHCYNTI
jgi:ABC-type molybdate transport system substrate-binding protein